jgi:hypothetical protein
MFQLMFELLFLSHFIPHHLCKLIQFDSDVMELAAIPKIELIALVPLQNLQR